MNPVPYRNEGEKIPEGVSYTHCMGNTFLHIRIGDHFVTVIKFADVIPEEVRADCQNVREFHLGSEWVQLQL